MAERGNFRAVWFGLGTQCNRIGRKGVEFRCATCPVAFSLSAFITSHHTQQDRPPPPGSLGDLIRLGSCCQQLSGARSLCSLLPSAATSLQPPRQRQSSLEKHPSPDFQLLGGLKRVNTYSWLRGRAAAVDWGETSP